MNTNDNMNSDYMQLLHPLHLLEHTPIHQVLLEGLQTLGLKMTIHLKYAV